MLETFFYQSLLKGNHTNIEGISDKFKINSKYALIYFKLHYKNTFTEKIDAYKENMPVLLKELIKLYISTYFENSYTFPVEDDQIISIVNVEKQISDISGIINEICDKLKYEEEYVYFTIAFSKVSTDTSQINVIYNKLFNIAKYRKLIDSTQVLSEDIIKTYGNTFYFSDEQKNRVISLLTKGLRDQCIECIVVILDHNFKKGVSSFYIQHLCEEIVNCCIDVLVKVFCYIPEEIDVNSVKSKLGDCMSISCFKDLTASFITKVTDYINSHKQGNDYIIDFILNYVTTHYYEDIYLDLLSEKLNITNNYISTYFKNKMGINLVEYINNFRINKSVELMQNARLSVNDISRKTGFSNVNTYIRIFKKYYGESPAQYRRKILISS